MAKVRRTNILIPVERYCHKKVHVQYECSNINDERCHFLKNRSNVKVKRFSTNRNILSKGLHVLMWNIKALALTDQKFLTKLTYSKNRSNSGQGHRLTNGVTSSTHDWKVLSKLKVSDRMKNRTKTICPGLRSQGHKTAYFNDL